MLGTNEIQSVRFLDILHSNGSYPGPPSSSLLMFLWKVDLTGEARICPVSTLWFVGGFLAEPADTGAPARQKLHFPPEPEPHSLILNGSTRPSTAIQLIARQTLLLVVRL